MDKCIQQLANRAAPSTVLQAKKVILQFVCRDHCHISQEELKQLRNKQQLYSAAAAWVRVGFSGRIVDLIFRLGQGKRPHRREFRAKQKGLSYDWRSPGKGCYGGRLGRHGFDGDSILGYGRPS